MKKRKPLSQWSQLKLRLQSLPQIRIKLKCQSLSKWEAQLSELSKIKKLLTVCKY